MRCANLTDEDLWNVVAENTNAMSLLFDEHRELDASIEVDAEGHFHFELCEGVRYSAFAFQGGARTGLHSAPVEFVPTKKSNKLVFILDKTNAEFMKLTRSMER